MTPTEQQFSAEMLSLLRVEYGAHKARHGDARAWRFLKVLSMWQGSHDWLLKKLTKQIVLPRFIYIDDAIVLAAAQANVLLKTLRKPKAIRDEEAEDAALAARGKKRRGRPKNEV